MRIIFLPPFNEYGIFSSCYAFESPSYYGEPKSSLMVIYHTPLWYKVILILSLAFVKKKFF